MRRDHVVTLLKQHEPEFRDAGVAALFLFGSVARDEAADTSDIDVFLISSGRRALPCSISWRYKSACRKFLEPRWI
jgi:predicted nucleotidyltransferase